MRSYQLHELHSRERLVLLARKKKSERTGWTLMVVSFGWMATTIVSRIVLANRWRKCRVFGETVDNGKFCEHKRDMRAIAMVPIYWRHPNMV